MATSSSYLYVFQSMTNEIQRFILAKGVGFMVIVSTPQISVTDVHDCMIARYTHSPT